MRGQQPRTKSSLTWTQESQHRSKNGNLLGVGFTQLQLIIGFLNVGIDK